MAMLSRDAGAITESGATVPALMTVPSASAMVSTRLAVAVYQFTTVSTSVAPLILTCRLLPLRTRLTWLAMTPAAISMRSLPPASVTLSLPWPTPQR